MIGTQFEGLTKENLQRVYVDDERATLESVASEIGCHRQTVARWLKRHGLPIKSRVRWHPKKSETQLLANKDWLENQLKTKSGSQIARELGTKHHNIWYWKKRHGLQVGQPVSEAIKAGLRKRFPDGLAGPNNPRWKGGRQIISGYVYVYAPDHPNAKRHRIQEHRLVMEQELGRYLEPDEVVHHIDSNRQNNDPDNLVVMSYRDHLDLHRKTGRAPTLRQQTITLRAENEELKAELAKVKEQLRLRDG